MEQQPDRVVLKYSRCLCAHATPLIIDQTVAYLLYERACVPQPVVELVHDVPTTTNQQSPGPLADVNCASRARLRFCEQLTLLRDSLRELYRTRNAGRVHEVCLLLGASPLTPVDVYRIRVRTDCATGCEHSTGQQEGPMSLRDLQQTAGSLLAQNLAGHYHKLGSAAARRLHVLVYAHRNAHVHDALHIKDNFELPPPAKVQRLKINMTHISIKHGLDCARAADKEDWSLDRPDAVWFALSTPVVGFE